jgi:hypothetical protein
MNKRHALSEMHRTASFLVSSVVIIFLSAIGISAQVFNPFATPTPTPTPKPTPEPRVYACPSMTVQRANPGLVRIGQPIGFFANIVGGDPKIVPTIVWTTSAGTITQGQGSRRIVIDSTGADVPDREIRADVWVGGYAPECALQGFATTKVIPPAVNFGSFGELPDDKVSENLKALAGYISQIPEQDNVWLIVYSGRESERGFAYNRVKKIKDELVADGVSPRRVIGMDGGYMEKPLFDFWIVPFGAQPPQPKPTIDRREIMNQKPRPANPKT